MPRIVHFDIPADDPQRAIRFYERVFGWKVKKWEGPADYWLVTTGPDDKPGINGGIAKRMDPSARTHNTIDVPSVDEYTKKIVEAGGKVVRPKIPIPGVGYIAYCTDTEGSFFGVIQMDPSAR